MKVIFTVTTDLSYDQRMGRICSALAEAGFEIELVGRKRKISKPLEQKKYKQTRLFCWFDKGKAFYIEYNLRLFVYLLFSKTDVFGAIDLDTALPNLWASKLKGKKLVYDAHEYFSELEEVVSRPKIKKAWKAIERYFVPKVDAAYTISNGYKKLFEDEYPINFEIIRNVGEVNKNERVVPSEPIILYQGAVNYGRGLEQTIEAMQNINAKLLICGKGDVFDILQVLAKKFGVEKKVEFKGFVSPKDLRKITPTATIGLTLFTDEGLSNKHSLCNRFFDYYLAGIPQLAVGYPEYLKFNEEFEVAKIVNRVDPNEIANGLNELLNNKELYKKLEVNCQKAREAHNWVNEKIKLVKIYSNLFSN
jgi:glycosyltransferase involved in cell wall biosynthesis